MLKIESAGHQDAQPEPGFWRRQFGRQPTAKQTIFDASFGIALPLLCFIFDPIVFRGNFFGGVPLLGRLQLLVYTISLIEICTLGLWLMLRGERLGTKSSAVGGFLYTGAFISLLLGIILLPLSLLGIGFFGLGLLGLTPFFTAFVFWRNAHRAVTSQRANVSGRRKLLAFALGLLFIVGAPLAIDLKLSSEAQSALATILEGDARQTDEAIERLRLLNYLIYLDTDKIVWAYHIEQDAGRRERLAQAYQRLTGKDIEARRTYLID